MAKKIKKSFFKRFRFGIALLVFCAICLTFFNVFDFAFLLKIQFVPSLLSCLTAFSVGALTILLGILLMTFFLGRFYCSIICPFGFLQEVIDLLAGRKVKKISNFRKTRYAILGVVFGALLGGTTLGFLFLDPYSNFGRIIGSFSVGGIFILLLITFLVVFQRRIFCVSICPVGTMLGLVSKIGIFRLAIVGKCVKCGKCAQKCPTGSIDFKNGKIDNERCIRCLACVSNCPLSRIEFRFLGKKDLFIKAEKELNDSAKNEPRRHFFKTLGILLAGVAVGGVVVKTMSKTIMNFAHSFKILPPGAGDANRFIQKCTACQLCVSSCPEKIIVPAPLGMGPVSLDLSRGHCLFDCHKCSEVCPTAAIKPLTLLAKQRTKIAEAKFYAKNCIVFQEDEKCGKCAEVCPVGAIRLRKSGAPYPVNTDLCIGCGACQNICPASEKAMQINEIEMQITLKN